MMKADEPLTPLRIHQADRAAADCVVPGEGGLWHHHVDPGAILHRPSDGALLGYCVACGAEVRIVPTEVQP